MILKLLSLYYRTGTWGTWTSFSSCSISCGGGKQTRTRACEGDGACLGINSQEAFCNQNPCPVPGMDMFNVRVFSLETRYGYV